MKHIVNTFVQEESGRISIYVKQNRNSSVCLQVNSVNSSSDEQILGDEHGKGRRGSLSLSEKSSIVQPEQLEPPQSKVLQNEPVFKAAHTSPRNPRKQRISMEAPIENSIGSVESHSFSKSTHEKAKLRMRTSEPLIKSIGSHKASIHRGRSSPSPIPVSE